MTENDQNVEFEVLDKRQHTGFYELHIIQGQSLIVIHMVGDQWENLLDKVMNPEKID